MSARPEIGMMFENHQLCDPSYLPDYDEVVSTVGGHLLADYGNNLQLYREDRNMDEITYPLKFGITHGTFEILNKDNVDRLTKYLAQKALRINPNGEKVKIAEIGAGLGRLTHFVCQSALSQGIDNLDMVATDTGEMARRKGLYVPFDVMRESYDKTLSGCKPQIVVSSWMPAHCDWTQDFRNAQSVQEYILIGQPNLCGKPTSWAEHPGNFARIPLDDLSDTQLGYRDDFFPYDVIGEPTPPQVHRSRTVSFTRV
ncbi:MAG: hypothetical protein NTV39_04155 [Candidatus Saccharibacteria bacterium]|nr:hypothetical protein [Candidatus Saccharibacteria bacterium]